MSQLRFLRLFHVDRGIGLVKTNGYSKVNDLNRLTAFKKFRSANKIDVKT